MQGRVPWVTSVGVLACGGEEFFLNTKKKERVKKKNANTRIISAMGYAPESYRMASTSFLVVPVGVSHVMSVQGAISAARAGSPITWHCASGWPTGQQCERDRVDDEGGKEQKTPPLPGWS